MNGEKVEGEERESKGINPFQVEGEDDEEGSSDDDEGGFGRSGFEDNFDNDDGVGVSITREAKRRTSLEDEDEYDGRAGIGGVGAEDDEVVHVGMVEEEGEGGIESEAGSGSASKGLKEDTRLKAEEVDDGELVHVQHAEMQEGSKKE